MALPAVSSERIVPFLTPADLLAAGLALPAVAEPAHDLPPGATCAITGQPIARGYRVADMVTAATSNFLDVFRGGLHGHVSEAAARCFRSANPRAGNPCARSLLIFADGTAYQPLIALNQADAQGRPAWRRLVRAIWPDRRGQQMLAILTSDTKRRLWPTARVGALGPRTPLYLYDTANDANSVLLLDWPSLLACLDLVEEIYAAGVTKALIRAGILAASTAVAAVGAARVAAWERALATWRPRPEFAVAVTIAQRDEEPPRPAPTARSPARRAPAPPAPPLTHMQGRLF